MAKKAGDKKLVDALAEAKKLESEHVPTREELTEIYKKSLAEAEELRKQLKPSWFVKDVHVEKSKKTKKKVL